MARIPQEIINRINDTADIVEIVSKYVDLKQKLNQLSLRIFGVTKIISSLFLF